MECNTKRFCEHHWPKDLNRDPHGIFILLLLEDKISHNKKFINKALEFKDLNKAYEFFSPICCYLGENNMIDIYDVAGEIAPQENH